MTMPNDFTSTTARHALPFLFPGQAQREFFVNESLARIDMLLHPSIKGEAASPPSDPVEGDCYVVASGGEGEWAGRDHQIAGWSGGSWTFAEPREGMVVRDLTTASSLVYTGTWTRPQAPAEPSGGSVIDAEARTAIGEVVAILRQFGLFV